jgi:hypothetical protein
MSHVDLVSESRRRRHAVGMPLCGLMPRPDIALAAQPNVIRSVARQALTASRAQLEPLTRILAAALPPCFVNIAAHRRAFSSTRRPAAVIRTLATSILREPAIIRSAVAVARPASTSSIMPLIANPCACRMPSGQPLSQDASNSSARMRSGLMSRLWRRVGIVHCLRALYRFNRYLDTLFQWMEPNSSLRTCVESRGAPLRFENHVGPGASRVGAFSLRRTRGRVGRRSTINDGRNLRLRGPLAQGGPALPSELLVAERPPISSSHRCVPTDPPDLGPIRTLVT